MIRYISADLYRIFRRKARLIIAIIILYLVGDVFRPHMESDTTIVEMVDMIETMLKYAPPIIGFLEMFYVFADDFAGKTAQIAIGIGIKRREVVLTKWADMVIISAIDITVIAALASVLSSMKSGAMPTQLLVSVISHAVVAVMSIAVYTSVVMPIMFAMQSVVVSNILYLILSFGLIFKLLEYVAMMEKLQKFNIGSITLTNALNVLRSRMLLGNFHIVSFMTIIIYGAAGILITYLIYRNRELEF